MSRLNVGRPLFATAGLYAVFTSIFILTAYLWVASDVLSNRNHIVLDIEYFGSTKTDQIYIYINDGGQPDRIKTGTPGRRMVKVPLGDAPLTRLRIDPTTSLRRTFTVHGLYIQKSDGTQRALPHPANAQRVALSGLKILSDGRLRAVSESPSIVMALNETLPASTPQFS